MHRLLKFVIRSRARLGTFWRRKAKKAFKLPQRNPQFEPCEERRMLSAISWANNAGHASWNDTSAWVGGVVPTSSDTAVFPAAASIVTPNVTANASVAGITIDNSGADYSITQSGGTWTLTLGSSGIAVSTPRSTVADTSTISPNLSLSANQTFTTTNNTGVTTLSVTGVISGSASLTKDGSGTLIVCGYNTYTGATTINAGVIEASGDGSDSPLNYFGDSSSTVTLADGVTLQADDPAGQPVIVSNPIDLSGGNVTVNIPFGDLTDIELDGVISGPGGLTVTSDFSGRHLTLTADNTFEGGVVLSSWDAGSNDNDGSPIVMITDASALGTGTLRSEIALDDRGGLYAWADLSSTPVTNDIEIDSGCNLTVLTDYSADTGLPCSLALSGAISGGGAVFKDGVFQLTLSGDNSYVGATTVDAGTLDLESPLYGPIAVADGAYVTGPYALMAPAVITEAADQVVLAGNTATFTAAASGSPTPTVQWKVSSDGGATFNPISGATSTTYSFTPDASDGSSVYEVVFTNSGGTATSAPAQLTVLSSALPVVSIYPDTPPTSNNGGGSVTCNFTVTLTDAAGNPWTGTNSLDLSYSVSSSGNPWQSLQSPQEVTIPAGNSTWTVSYSPTNPGASSTVYGAVYILQDTVNESYVRSSTHDWAMQSLVGTGATPLICAQPEDVYIPETTLGSHTFTFYLSSAQSGPLTVSYAFAGLPDTVPAVEGTDFSVSYSGGSGTVNGDGSGGTITFGTGNTTVSVTITALSASLGRGERSLAIVPTTGSGYQIAANRDPTLILTDTGSLLTDADNNAFDGVPDGAAAEWADKDLSAKNAPGKYITVQNASNTDTIPFVPVQVYLYGLTNDVPTNDNPTGTGDYVTFTESGASLGLYTGSTSDDSGTQIVFGQSYSLSDLGLNPGSAPNTLYVEATQLGTAHLQLWLDQAGLGWSQTDEVKFTVLDENVTCLECTYGISISPAGLDLNSFDPANLGANIYMSSATPGNTSVARPQVLVLTGNGVAVLQNDKVDIWDDDLDTGDLTPRKPAAQGTMQDNGSTFVETDLGDTVWTFAAPDPLNGIQDFGLLTKMVNAYGNETDYYYYSGTNQLAAEIATVGPAVDGHPSEQLTTFATSDGVVTGQSATLGYADGTSTDGTLVPGTTGLYWHSSGTASQTVGSADYAYGDSGNLELITAYDPAGDASGATYYRYYGSGASENQLEYMLSPDSLNRLMTANSLALADIDLLSDLNAISDADVAPYADNYLQYDSSGLVTSNTAAGAGATTYANALSGFADGINTWTYEQIATQANGTTTASFYNFEGDTLVSDVSDGTQHWITYNEYDSNGNVVESAQPSAIDTSGSGYVDALSYTEYGYNSSDSGLDVSLNADSGLIDVYTYYDSTTADTTTPGGVAGWAFQTAVAQGADQAAIAIGDTGGPILQSSTDYIAAADGANTSYFTHSSTQYQNTDGTGAETTTYAYTFIGTSIAVETTTLPTVDSSHGGSGSASASTDVYDSFGRVVWSKDANGSISYTAYDPATGAAVEQIRDADLAGNLSDTRFQSDLALLSGLGWTTSTAAGYGENLTTKYVVDSQGRTIVEIDPNGNETVTVYDDPDHEVRTYPGWHFDAGIDDYATTGPISVTRDDLSGGYSESLTYAWTGSGDSGFPTRHVTYVGAAYIPTGTESLASAHAVIQSLSRSIVNAAGQAIKTRDYTAMPPATMDFPNGYSTNVNIGDPGDNYLQTDMFYDSIGRAVATIDPAGNMRFTVYDAQGEATDQWTGTVPLGGSYADNQSIVSTFATAIAGSSDVTYSATGVSLYKVSHTVYDIDGNPIESDAYFDPTGTAAPRATYSQYDWQDRQIATLGPDGVATVSTLDNLGETTEVQTYASATISGGVISYSSGDLRAQSEEAYNLLGQVFESRTDNVAPETSSSPSPGTVGDFLPTDTWYDSNGNVLATRTGTGAIQKTDYNGASETIETYTVAEATATADLTFAEATALQAGDTVVEQTQMWHDADGNTIASAEFKRLPGDTTAGALDATDSYVTASVSFFDQAGRDIEDVDYGRVDVISTTATAFFDTDGSLIAADDGNPSVTEDTPPATNSSDDYLVSRTAYINTSSAGPIVDTTDNAGIVTETRMDLLGRTTRTIQNFDGLAYGAYGSGFDSDGDVLAADTAGDVTTDYQYDAYGRMVTMTVYDADGSTVTPQASKYLYTSSIDASMQTIAVAPDSTDTLSQGADGDWTITSGTDHTTTTYDVAGETLTSTDQRGVAHSFFYDTAGRPTQDEVTNFGDIPAAGQAIDEIDTSYDDIGRVYQVTSYGEGTSVVLNQVQYVYDGWGNEAKEWQAQTGAVDSGSTPNVQYVYADGAVDGVAQFVRLTDVVYPNGRDISNGYGTSGSVDDIMSRLVTISDTSGTIASYTYLGADVIASQNDEQPQIALDYSAGNFAALDRFSRVHEQVWSSYGSASGTLGAVDGYNYTYDRAGNRTVRENAVDGVMSETYDYNALNELTSMARGTLSGPTIPSPTYTQTWTLDSLGNFSNFNDNGSSQDQTVNAANEIQSISGGAATPAYDAAGNMTTTPKPGDETTALTNVYDAWNRLVEVDISGVPLVQYHYDATGRMVAELSGFTISGLMYVPTAVTYSFYAGQNAIETRTTTFTAGDAPTAPESAPVQYQFIFSAMGAKTPLVRDTYVSGTLSADNRIYYLSDANTNATAIVGYDAGTSTWAVAERYVYNPYGAATVYDPAYTTVIGTSLAASTVGNTLGFASMNIDPLTGLYYDEARWYSTAVSTFVSRDPAQADENLYRYCGNMPTQATDPSGMASRRWSASTWYALNATTKTVVPGDWGGFMTNLNWSVHPAPLAAPTSLHLPTASWIVQHVTVSFDVKDAGTKRPVKFTRGSNGALIDDGTWDYLEAWQVAPGKTEAVVGRVGTFTLPRDDTFRMPNGQRNTCGIIIMRGITMFYPNTRLPNDFDPGGVVWAGSLYSTSNVDAMKEIAPRSISPVVHIVLATWDTTHQGRTQVKNIIAEPVPEPSPGAIA